MFITIKLDSNNKPLVTEQGNSRCSCRVRIEQPKGNIYSHFSVFKNISSFISHSFFSLQQNEVDIKPEKAEAALVTCLIPSCTGAGQSHTGVVCWGQPALHRPAHQHQGLFLLNLHLQKQLHFAKHPLRKSVELGSPAKMLCRIAGGKHYIQAKSFMGWVNEAGEITSVCWREQNQEENERSHAHQGCTESRAVNSCGCHLLK